MIRADLATVLRLWLDGSQSTLLAGGNADPVKLLSVVEALTKLVPESEHKSRREDPREYMLKTYLEMRKRGAAFGQGYDGLKLTVERLQAELAAKDAEIARLTGAPADVPTLVETVPAPAGDNVVKLPVARDSGANAPKSGANAPPKPAPPQYELVPANEPWRAYTHLFE
jgi:hypothetical protein